MIDVIFVFLIIGSIIFTIFLPQMWWDISWSDIFTIISGKDESINQITDITKLMQALGLTEDNLKSWATERLLICLAILITLIIAFSILYKIFKSNNKSNSQSNSEKNKNIDTSNEDKTTNDELSQKEKIGIIIAITMVSILLIVGIIFMIISLT